MRQSHGEYVNMTALVPGQHDVARSMAARPEPAFRALEVRTGALVDIVGEAAPFPHRALTELAGVDGHPRDAWVRGVQTRRSVGWLSSERLLRRCGGWRSRNSAHPGSSDHLFRQPSLRLEAARLPLERQDRLHGWTRSLPRWPGHVPNGSGSAMRSH